jgi:hypothetical protein
MTEHDTDPQIPLTEPAPSPVPEPLPPAPEPAPKTEEKDGPHIITEEMPVGSTLTE